MSSWGSKGAMGGVYPSRTLCGRRWPWRWLRNESPVNTMVNDPPAAYPSLKNRSISCRAEAGESEAWIAF